MKVSVIVPIYKIPEKLLRICIDSILGQTLKEFELILINDGNGDEITSLCDEYAKLDRRIIVIHQDNQGVSVSRNKGIRISKSEYITFVDADDMLIPNMLLSLYNIANEHKVDMVICNNISINEDDNHAVGDSSSIINANMYTFNEKVDLRLLQSRMIGETNDNKMNINGAPWAKLYRKKLIVENDVYFKKNLIRSQDNEFNFRLFNFITSVAYTNEILYCYRDFSGSAMNKYTSNSREIQERYLIELKKEIDKIEDYDFNNVFHKAVVSKISDILKTQYVHPLNRESEFSKINNIRTFLNSSPYQESLSMVIPGDFNKMKKILLILAKRECYFLIYILYSLRGKLKKTTLNIRKLQNSYVK